MHIKNGITVALQVLPIFPLLEDHGKELYSVMEKLSERADLTPDLKQGCKAYMVQLQKRITVSPYLKQEDYAAVSPLHRSTTLLMTDSSCSSYSCQSPSIWTFESGRWKDCYRPTRSCFQREAGSRGTTTEGQGVEDEAGCYCKRGEKVS